MAHAHYNLLWQKAMEELSELIEVENPPPQYDANGRVIPERPMSWNAAHRHYALLYIKYLQVFRKLEKCHDQIVHPQKRRDIRVTLDVVMARVVQLKAQLSVFGPGGRQSDFPNLDGYLVGLKLAPADLDVPIPHYFKERRPEDEAEADRRALLAKCLDERGVAGAALPSEDSTLPVAGHMTRERAIQIIQKNERGRQAAARARLLKELRDEDAMRQRHEAAGALERDPHAAATVIQKAVRGFLSRLRSKADAAEELVFLGMEAAPGAGGALGGGGAAGAGAAGGAGAGGYDPVVKAAQVRKSRKARQADHEVLYGEALVELEQQVSNAVGPELRDALWTERYEWWLGEKQRTGKAPKSLDGYYAMVAERDKPPEDPAAVEAAQKKAEAEAEAARRAKRNAAAGRTAAPSVGRKRKEEEPASKVTQVSGSDLMAPLTETVIKYRELWATMDESQNHAQTHDETVARAKLLPEVKERIQAEVDVQLLGYLENIQAKLAAGKKKKGKGKAKKGDGSKKGAAGGDGKKKAKGGAKTKRKKWIEGEKACAHMSLVDMITALIKLNILQDQARARPLGDYVGDINYIGSVYQDAGVPVDPTAAQIRQTLTELFVLPQGSAFVKEHVPARSALLLYGPRGTGKTMLTRSLAWESRAVWLDLSPANLDRKLGAKAEIQKLLYMVFRVAKELQPAVVFIDEAEKMWAAGKGKTKTGAPRKNNTPLGRVRKSLAVQRAALAPTDRVIVVGNSRQPFHARTNIADLCKFFDYQHQGKMIYCPCPGYHSRLQLWARFIENTGLAVSQLARSDKFDLSTLAFITEGFSAGAMEQAVQMTLTPRRVEKILATGKELDMAELLKALAKMPYTYQEEYVAFANFTFLVTGEKERLRLMQLAALKEEELRAAAAKKQGLRKPSKPKA